MNPEELGEVHAEHHQVWILSSLYVTLSACCALTTFATPLTPERVLWAWHLLQKYDKTMKDHCIVKLTEAEDEQPGIFALATFACCSNCCCVPIVSTCPRWAASTIPCPRVTQ